MTVLFNELQESSPIKSQSSLLWKENKSRYLCKINGKLEGENYRLLCFAILKNVRKKNIDKITFDLSKLQFLSKDEIYWTAYQFYPLLARTSMKEISIKEPEDLFAKISLNQLKDMIIEQNISTITIRNLF